MPAKSLSPCCVVPLINYHKTNTTNAMELIVENRVINCCPRCCYFLDDHAKGGPRIKFCDLVLEDTPQALIWVELGQESPVHRISVMRMCLLTCFLVNVVSKQRH